MREPATTQTITRATATKLDSREEHFRIPSGINSCEIFLRYLPALPAIGSSRVVLYVHGATFSSALSIAHRFDGRSWRDDLAAAGYRYLLDLTSRLGGAAEWQIGFGRQPHLAKAV